MNTWMLYEHRSPSQNVYVGIAPSSMTFKWDEEASFIHEEKFCRAIERYGWNNIEHTIIIHNLGKRTAEIMRDDLIAFYTNNNMSYN
jgi:hypothetical protein